MKKQLLILLCLPFFSFGQFNRLDAITVDSINSKINAHQAAHNWVGMSVGIIMNGEIAFLDGYGVVNRATFLRPDANSIYRVASNTKSMTAVLILKLAEMGLLSLEDFVQQYVPEYPSDSGKDLIKIRHLLSHESGIIQYEGCFGSFSDSINQIARDNYISSHGNYYDPISAIDVFKDQSLCFTPPGTNYNYTTWGYCLLAAVIERASGTSYQDFFFDNIVCPMKMPALQIEFQDRVPYPNQVTGYKYIGNVASCSTCSTTLSTSSRLHPPDISYKMGGGGSVASVTDMVLYMKGLVNNMFIDSSSFALMGTNGFHATYGYGFNRGSDVFGNRVYHHGGNQTGTTTYLRVSPITKHGVVVMFNTERVGQRNTLCIDLYNLLFSATLHSSPIFLPTSYTRDVPPTSIHINPGIYESNYGVNSTGQVHSGDKSKLKAKNIVKLKPGFEALQGSYFRVNVNCD